MAIIRLKAVAPTSGPDGFSISCAVVGAGIPPELWFRVRSTANDREPPDALNWALVALLLPAMRSGQDIHVDGRVSARLLFNVNRDVQAALRVYDPGLTRIDITAAEVSTDGRRGKQRVGTGFSAGIDSFAMVSLFVSQSDRPGLSLTDLCVFNVGAFGPCAEPHVNQRFATAHARALAFARRIGASVTAVDSNIDQFFDPHWSFQQTHSLRNVAAVLVVERFIDYYLYSSAFPLESIRVMPHDALAIMDPILLPLLSTEKLEFRSGGAGLSRFEKTALVARNELSYDQLDVCVSPAEKRKSLDRPNCSRCWKCNRTMLTLDLLGALDKYARVFDVPYYLAHREKIVQAVAGRAYRGSEIDREVFAKFGELRLTAYQRAFFYMRTLRNVWMHDLRAGVRTAKKRRKTTRRKRAEIASR